MEAFKSGLRLAVWGGESLRWWWGDGWREGESGAVPLTIDEALEVMGRQEYRLCALLLEPVAGGGGVVNGRGDEDAQSAGAAGGAEQTGQ